MIKCLLLLLYLFVCIVVFVCLYCCICLFVLLYLFVCIVVFIPYCVRCCVYLLLCLLLCLFLAVVLVVVVDAVSVFVVEMLKVKQHEWLGKDWRGFQLRHFVCVLKSLFVQERPLDLISPHYSNIFFVTTLSNNNIVFHSQTQQHL